ncbi:hypothetical protein [Streptosporangium sp. V21-05]|uniref:hypothetical protein n=1 Tax=Streptosporangium sp. V21-05 TaxID=3446115 RepID=UPI003F532FF0
MNDLPSDPPDPPEIPGPPLGPGEDPGARRALAGLVLAVFAGLLAYRVLHAGHLEQTALFYVGVPAVIAVTVVLTVRPRTVTGLIMAVITVALAIAGPLLNEGVVCLLFAAPIFYLVGLLVGLAVDHSRRRGTNGLVAPLVLLAVLGGGGEMVAPPRDSEVTVVRPASGARVERALAVAPRFGRFDSPFLRLGFPAPVRAEGAGLEVGDRREITFTPRRPLGVGALPEPRSMTLRVKERSPGRVTFSVVRDTTVARWMDLREAEFAWGGDRLSVTLRYGRTFDPGWYFDPLQRYAAAEAAGYLAGTFTR